MGVHINGNTGLNRHYSNRMRKKSIKNNIVPIVPNLNSIVPA